MSHRYRYLGDKMTCSSFKGQLCSPVRRPDGKCIVSVKMATALVRFADGREAVVARRRLRLEREQPDQNPDDEPGPDPNP